MQEAHLIYSYLLLCISRIYPYPPQRARLLYTPPPIPLEFPLYTVGGACHSPPPPLNFHHTLSGVLVIALPPTFTPWNFRKFSTWLGTLWKVYLCQKYCCTLLLYAKDNFSAAIRCLIISRTFLANNKPYIGAIPTLLTTQIMPFTKEPVTFKLIW